MKLVARRGEELVEMEVERAGESYRVRMGNEWQDVDFVKPNDLLVSIRTSDGSQYTVVDQREGGVHRVFFENGQVDVEVHDPLEMQRRLRSDEAVGATAVLRAVMPGRVVRVNVSEGENVEKGQGLLVLEAMKMENEIEAPRDGTVSAVHVSDGETVEAGAELVTVE